MNRYFGTDGFRGEANRRLTPSHAYLTGRFLGIYAQQEKRSGRVLIGRDPRRSGPMLSAALAAGVMASGGQVTDLQVTSTPCLAMLTPMEGYACAAMVTASHNPFADNGLKLMDGQGAKLQPAVLTRLEALLDGTEELPEPVTGGEIGPLLPLPSGGDRYLDALCRQHPLSLNGLRIGLDCANGSLFRLAPRLFRRLGAQVTVMGCAPDGVNINDGVGSTHMEGLCQLVRRHRLDVGFAFDGDGDRCLCVDEAGRPLTGDHILWLCARWLHAQGWLIGGGVAATVMSNLGLRRGLEAEGIRLHLTDVGDQNVRAAMDREGLALGGEQSGHILFGDAPSGDGLVTALQVLTVMQNTASPLSRLTGSMEVFPQLLRNLPKSEKTVSTADVETYLDRLRHRLGSRGRILLRPSGTEPVLRLMVEAETESLCKWAMEEAEKAVASCGNARLSSVE